MESDFNKLWQPVVVKRFSEKNWKCGARWKEGGFWNPVAVNMAVHVKPGCFAWWSKMEKSLPRKWRSHQRGVAVRQKFKFQVAWLGAWVIFWVCMNFWCWCHFKHGSLESTCQGRKSWNKQVERDICQQTRFWVSSWGHRVQIQTTRLLMCSAWY